MATTEIKAFLTTQLAEKKKEKTRLTREIKTIDKDIGTIQKELKPAPASKVKVTKAKATKPKKASTAKPFKPKKA